jgi:hypothetical protein
MQRRAAAAYIAFFLVIAAGTYAFIATADAPAVTISGDSVSEIEEGDTVSAGDRTYTVSDVSAEVEEGGDHGGGGGIAYSITFRWTNQSALYTATWASNSTADWDGVTYRVMTVNGTDRAVVRWEPTAKYSASWTDGRQFIDGDLETPGRQDVPLHSFVMNSTNSSIEYRNVTEGDVVEYRGNETTVRSVTNSSAVLSWTGPRATTTTVGNDQNVSLNDEPFVVHFKNNDTVLLGEGEASQEALQATKRDNDRFHDRINGFWGVAIGSLLTVIILGSVALLPHKE